MHGLRLIKCPVTSVTQTYTAFVFIRLQNEQSVQEKLYCLSPAWYMALVHSAAVKYTPNQMLKLKCQNGMFCNFKNSHGAA